MHDLEAVFLLMIHDHSAIIHKICRIYRDSPEDQEDLFQEITFQLWKSYPNFRGVAAISSWLYRIALNTAISTYRKKKPMIQYTDALPDIPDDQPDEAAGMRRERFFAALQQLDDSEKALITLYLEELSYHQIAEITGISENYVGVKLNRIKNKLQKLIK